MHCYRDMTFCASECANENCHRHSRQIPSYVTEPICFGLMRNDRCAHIDGETQTDAAKAARNDLLPTD